MKDAEKVALEAIYNRDGRLKPEVIVSEAADPAHPLHSRFSWDDSEAAKKHRLNEARQLIRLAVVIIPALSNGAVRQYVSLSSLRRDPEGSYLATVDILSDEAKYAQAFADAVTALGNLKKRYAHIRELAPLWGELSRILADADAGRKRVDAA